MLRKMEIDWFYQEGCSYIYPDEWEKYLSAVTQWDFDTYLDVLP